MSDYLTRIIGIMVSKNLAVYEPAKQTRAVLLYWRLPEEWAEVLHEWVRDPSFPPSSLSISSAPCGSHIILRVQATSTGQMNTILTFYEISDPPVPSALSGIPDSLLRSAIAILAKSGRAQLISISDGDGVRLFPRNVKC
jgi:ESCRT-II complex subunit VPS25